MMTDNLEMFILPKVNFVAVITLSVCVFILLLIALIGWLHKCQTHKNVVKSRIGPVEKDENCSESIPQTQSESDETIQPERNV